MAFHLLDHRLCWSEEACFYLSEEDFGLVYLDVSV